MFILIERLFFQVLRTESRGSFAMKNKLAIFEDYKIRRVYDETTETWYFSVVDII